MEMAFGLLGLLIVLDLAALRWGADSRYNLNSNVKDTIV
jgi:hypothetical protein